MRFKIGDVVQIKRNFYNTYKIHAEYTYMNPMNTNGIVVSIEDESWNYRIKVLWNNGYKNHYKEKHLKWSNNNFMRIAGSIADKVKRMSMSSDDKALLDAGLIDDCGNYTEEAREVAINKLIDTQREELVAVAKEVLKEEKKNK